MMMLQIDLGIFCNFAVFIQEKHKQKKQQQKNEKILIDFNEKLLFGDERHFSSDLSYGILAAVLKFNSFVS